MKRVLSLVVLLSLSIALAQGAPPVVKIGTLNAYTGALAEFGPAIRNGAELAAKQINEAAEAVFGGPIIELVHADAATNPAVAVDQARSLVNTEGVVAIVGALSSGVTVPVAESVAIPSEVVMISPASTSPLISVMETDSDWLFRTVASDALQGIVGAQLARGEIVDGYEGMTAATIYVNNPYGQGLSRAFAEAFEARGGQVLAQVPHPEEPQPTYASVLESALAGDPDIVLAISYPGQATVYMAEARDLYAFDDWQLVDGTKSLEIVEAVGAEALAGDYGTAPGADPSWAGQERFVEQYEAEYGDRPPLPFIDTAYDAVATLGLAIAQTIADGEEVTSAAIRDRLRQVAGPEGEVVGVGEFEEAFRLIELGTDIDYTGAAGTVDYDDAGDVVTPVEIWQFNDAGEIESVMIRTADQIPTE
ncbi:MAG TPA: ABC transporter substrate-binding protein [Trueperaceae bacterium]